MTPAPKTTGRIPPTAGIDEIEYQERLRLLYERLYPDVDPGPYLLGVAVQRIAASMRLQMDTEIYQPAGYSIAHIRILIALAAVGPTTPTELARFTQVSPSSISSVLRTLRQSGHVTRDELKEDADGRVRIVSLTAEGTSAMAKLMWEMRTLEERWAHSLPDAQRKRLVEILHRMARALGA